MHIISAGDLYNINYFQAIRKIENMYIVIKIGNMKKFKTAQQDIMR